MASATAPFERITITRRDPLPDEVVIDIKYAGICHSDIHTARGEWGEVIYPLVPGHEIAGVITAVGPEVTKFKVGDHAGIGCFVDACGKCKHCLMGEENACLERTIWTYNDIGWDGVPTAGGYSQQIVARADYVLKIPETIPLAAAAPLLCAGVTPWSPLVRYHAGPGTKLAVVGLGGLGHMAVQLGHALGCETTVISRTLRKKAAGIALGADHYYATEDPDTFEELAETFDLMICTISADLDVNALVSLLRLGGVLVFLGLPPDDQHFKIEPLCFGHKSITGSDIGGIPGTQAVLDFCAAKGISAKVEVISADEVTEAYNKVVAGIPQFRYVIDIATL
jgi:uncharacterized zinc-type alcohol dehydrogenase-like protein